MNTTKVNFEQQAEIRKQICHLWNFLNSYEGVLAFGRILTAFNDGKEVNSVITDQLNWSFIEIQYADDDYAQCEPCVFFKSSNGDYIKVKVQLMDVNPTQLCPVEISIVDRIHLDSTEDNVLI